MVPQVGSHESESGFADASNGFVVDFDESGCTNRNCALSGGEFMNDGKNVAVCGGVMPTGTVAVRGVIETRIPESRPTCPVPVFLWSASAVAIKLIMGIGFGKLLKDGAV